MAKLHADGFDRLWLAGAFNQNPDHLSPKQLWRQLQADIHQAIFDPGFQQGLEQGRREASLQIT